MKCNFIGVFFTRRICHFVLTFTTRIIASFNTERGHVISHHISLKAKLMHCYPHFPLPIWWLNSHSSCYYFFVYLLIIIIIIIIITKLPYPHKLLPNIMFLAWTSYHYSKIPQLVIDSCKTNIILLFFNVGLDCCLIYSIYIS